MVDSIKRVVTAILCLSVIFLALSGSSSEHEKIVLKPGSRANPGIFYTEAPETTIFANKKVGIDISNISKGYFAIKYKGLSDCMKVYVEKGDALNVYDIPNEKPGEYVFVPLHGGDGAYSVTVWEHIYEDLYRKVFTRTFDAALAFEMSPFLYPSAYVDFSEQNTAIGIAASLARYADCDLDVVKAVYDYLVDEIKYSKKLEKEVLAGLRYVTDIDEVLANKAGICVDYATLMVAMLRSQGVPAMVVAGSVERDGKVLYPSHAWVKVYPRDADEPGWIVVDPTHGATTKWQFGQVDESGLKAPHVDYVEVYRY